PYDEVEPAAFTPLKIDPSPDRKESYEPMTFVKPKLDELRKKSDARVVHDPEFTYIREDIIGLKAQLAEKSVSLNESKRLQEKKVNDERTAQREKERKLRKADQPIITEITLQSIGGTSSNSVALTRAVYDEAQSKLKDGSDEIDNS